MAAKGASLPLALKGGVRLEAARILEAPLLSPRRRRWRSALCLEFPTAALK